MKEYVLGFPFYKTLEGKEAYGARVLLLRKQKPEKHKGLLNGFGGAVGEAETCVQAMTREFHKESGISTVSREWRLFAKLEKSDCVVWCYVIHLDENRIDKAHASKPDIHYIHAGMPPYNIVPDLRYLLPLSLDQEISVVTITEQQK